MGDKVSIIVPVYNVAPYLARCLDSLLGQTHKELEVLLVDDCSKDESWSILETYMQKDPRVIAVRQPENCGVSAARNRALEMVSGRWICFCDGDDWYLSDFLEKMLQVAKEEQADYVVCNYQVVSDRRPAVISDSVGALYSGCDPRLAIACGPTASCTHLIHRSLFERSGVCYPVGCKQYEELPVISVLPKYAKRIGVCKEALYCYYQRGDGTSASNTSGRSEEFFLRAWAKMKEALGSGYEAEAEYHAIYALFYGEVLNACKRKESAKEIRGRIRRYKEAFPAYEQNPYLNQFGLVKKVFLMLERMGLVIGLRMLAWVHQKIVN